jgi:hypothetical protein
VTCITHTIVVADLVENRGITQAAKKARTGPPVAREEREILLLDRRRRQKGLAPIQSGDRVGLGADGGDECGRGLHDHVRPDRQELTRIPLDF